MDTPNFIPPLQQIFDPIWDEKGIKLYVLRTDLNHPEISGNKLYKLKYNLEEAKNQGKNTLLTFGGAFSNHIAATATTIATAASRRPSPRSTSFSAASPAASPSLSASCTW